MIAVLVWKEVKQMTQYEVQLLLEVLKSIDKSLIKISDALAYSPDTKIMSMSESNVLINDRLDNIDQSLTMICDAIRDKE